MSRCKVLCCPLTSITYLTVAEQLQVDVVARFSVPHWSVKSVFEDETRLWSHAWILCAYCSSQCGSLGSQGPPTPSLRATCCSPVRFVRRDLLWPPLLPGFSSLVQILRSSSAQHTHPLYTKRAGGSRIRTHSHTRTASIVAPLRKPKPELSPHLLLISSRRFCIRKSSRETRVIKENERRAASFFNCDCEH